MNFRELFPTLVNNPELIYLDNAASTQTPQVVIDRITQYYEHERCNVHRGDYPLSQKVTAELEDVRSILADYFVVNDPNKFAFNSGTTEGLNWFAEWYKHKKVVYVSDFEHTSNILPWLLQGRTLENGRLQRLPYSATEMWSVDREDSVIAFSGKSNVTGTTAVNWQSVLNYANDHNIPVCIDMAQQAMTGVNLSPFDKRNNHVYAVCSAHKMYGPTGVGAIYSNKGFDHVAPIIAGGGNVFSYSFNDYELVNGPARVEAGTPNIAGILGFGAAIEFITLIGGHIEHAKHIKEMSKAFIDAGVLEIDEIRAAGLVADLETNVFSLLSDHVDISDVGAYLATKNIAVRTGKLCAHPLVTSIDEKGLLRVSTAIYNTPEEAETFVKCLKQAIQKLT